MEGAPIENIPIKTEVVETTEGFLILGKSGAELGTSVLLNEQGEVVGFTEDIDSETLLVSQDDLDLSFRPLLTAGVPLKYKGWTADGESGTDWPAEIHIKKEDLNKALTEGGIKIKKTSDGTLTINNG